MQSQWDSWKKHCADALARDLNETNAVLPGLKAHASAANADWSLYFDQYNKISKELPSSTSYVTSGAEEGRNFLKMISNVAFVIAVLMAGPSLLFGSTSTDAVPAAELAVWPFGAGIVFRVIAWLSEGSEQGRNDANRKKLGEISIDRERTYETKQKADDELDQAQRRHDRAERLLPIYKG